MGGVGGTARVARSDVWDDRRYAGLPGALRSRDLVHATRRRPDHHASALQDDNRHLARGVPIADRLQLRLPALVPRDADLASRAGRNGAGRAVDDLRDDATDDATV